MLYRKNDAVLDFDLAKVIEQSRDNPVFYVQYGHARACSIFRNARDGVPGSDGARQRSFPTCLWTTRPARNSFPAHRSRDSAIRRNSC